MTGTTGNSPDDNPLAVTWGSPQGPLADLEAAGLSPAQAHAMYGQLLANGSIALNDQGVPITHAGDTVTVNLNDMSGAGIGNQAIADESATRSANAAQQLIASTPTDEEFAAAYMRDYAGKKPFGPYGNLPVSDQQMQQTQSVLDWASAVRQTQDPTLPGYYDQFGVRHADFCMSCHDNTPTASWLKEQSAVANEWPIFIGVTAASLAMGYAAPALGAASLEAEAASEATAALAGRATAPVEKFADYIFKEGATHGKDAVFQELGYTGEHSAQLAQMWEDQAATKFANGEYTLGKLDQYGQRINIEIEAPGISDAAGKTSYMRSGWMIQPDGSIRLNTPFSGFTRSR